MPSSRLILGPLLRYVDTTTASLWFEVDGAAAVTVRIREAAGERGWEARTFAVHGHHYALVEVEGLEPGSVSPYAVDVDGEPAWPPEPAEGGEGADALPPSVIATLAPGRPLRLAYGSCRTTAPHNERGNERYGVDALRAFALHLAGDPAARPDLLLFLGDQVYADESSEEMKAFIRARRDITEPPFDEIADYEEYAHLYRLAWSDSVTRWLLSTLPCAMIFDDHDVRDDWNTSWKWKQEMEATDWWHARIVSGLAAYWVYQHLGNLSPAARAEDEIYRRIAAAQAVSASEDELDLGDALDALAERVDQEPETYRWSYARDFDGTRLVVVDSRAARVLDPAKRAMLDEDEKAWLDEQMRGGFRYLLVATSIPFLLFPGLHALEGWDEAVVDGVWGRLGERLGRKLRRFVDLEHWPAFQRDFRDVAQMAIEVACGERGPAPDTVAFLSGDVHHSYLAEVRSVRGRPDRACQSRIVQAVCSPIRNTVPGFMRAALAVMSLPIAGPPAALVARLAKVPKRPFTWRATRRPWFDNNVALLHDTDRGLALSWHAGVLENGDPTKPVLREVEATVLTPRGSSGPGERG